MLPINSLCVDHSKNINPFDAWSETRNWAFSCWNQMIASSVLKKNLVGFKHKNINVTIDTTLTSVWASYPCSSHALQGITFSAPSSTLSTTQSTKYFPQNLQHMCFTPRVPNPVRILKKYDRISFIIEVCNIFLYLLILV